MAWLAGWNRRKSKIVNGTTAGIQTNYQLKLIVHKGSGTDTTTDVYLGTNVADNFGDLRFTDSDGTTPLSYWIESYVSGVSSTLWIKIPSIPTSPGTATIYIYYNNPGQTTTSNGPNTFLLFDDFNDNSIDTSKWVRDSPDPGSIDTYERNSRIEQAGSVSWTARNSFLRSVNTSFQNFALEVTHNQVSGSGSGNWEDSEGPILFRITNWNREGSGQFNFSGTAYELSHSRRDAYYGYASSFRIDRFANSPSLSIINRQPISFSQGTNYRIKLLVYGNSIKAYRDDALYINITDSNISGAGSVAIRGRLGDGGGVGSINNTFDDFRIRMYVSPEPTFGSSGTEELYTGTLSISSTPSGASIYINDVLQTGITTPATISNLNPGTYNVKLTLTNYHDWTTTGVVINSNATTNLSATFAGSASFSSTPSGAEIWLATSPGTPVDQLVQTPRTITNLTSPSSGATTAYNYKLTLTGYQDYIGTFTATAGQIFNISATLVQACGTPACNLIILSILSEQLSERPPGHLDLYIISIYIDQLTDNY